MYAVAGRSRKPIGSDSSPGTHAKEAAWQSASDLGQAGLSRAEVTTSASADAMDDQFDPDGPAQTVPTDEIGSFTEDDLDRLLEDSDPSSRDGVGIASDLVADSLVIATPSDEIDLDRAVEGLESVDDVLVAPSRERPSRDTDDALEQLRSSDEGIASSLEDPVRMYLREIGRVPLLTARSEVDLSMAMERAAYLIQLRKKLFERDGIEPDSVTVIVAIHESLRESWPHVLALATASASVLPSATRSEHIAGVLPMTRFADDLPASVAGQIGLTREQLEESLRLRQVEWDLLPAVLCERLEDISGDWLDEATIRSLLSGASRELQRAFDQRIVAGTSAKVALTEANLRLVVSVAKKYVGRGMSMLDLVQEGNLGLIRAVEKFQHHKGFRFSTYATWWIRQAISRAIADQARTIRIPVHMVETINRVVRTSRRLHQELGREPTSDEIGAAMEMTAERVREVLKISEEPISLGMPVGDEEDSSLGDFIEDRSAIAPPDAAANALLSEQMQLVLEELSDRERQVIVMRFGLDDGRAKTLEEVGREFSVTRERIRQIEAKALRKLRHPNRRQRLEDYLD